MKVSLSPYRRVLLASAASVAALVGGMLFPAAASAQPSGTPVTPTITLLPSPAAADYGHQKITASGTVITSAGPVAGTAVTVSYLDIDEQAAQISLAIGKNGSYSGTIPDLETAAQEVTASVAATSSTDAASASAQLGFTTDAVTITASFAQPAVNAGSTDKLSGVASYVSGGSPHSLANSTLSISSPGNLVIAPVSATVATGADGSFSYVTPEIGTADPSVDFTVSSAATPYLEVGQLNVVLPINQFAVINDFTGTIRQIECCGSLRAEAYPSRPPMGTRRAAQISVLQDSARAVEDSRHWQNGRRWPLLR